eukprot:gene4226-6002_t
MMHLPTISPNDLLIWDNDRNVCAGYLNKKASKQSAFSKGKWQKRWFIINLDINEAENYYLGYYHSPDDKVARSLYPLSYATIKISSGNGFIVTINDESNTTLTLSSESPKEKSDWIDTLEKVILVATNREKVQKESEDYENNNDAVGESNSVDGTNPAMSPNPPSRSPAIIKRTKEINFNNANINNNSFHVTHPVFRSKGKSHPTLRLNIDIDSIPPSSNARHRLLTTFANDLATCLSIPSECIEIVSVKPDKVMEWLVLIEFELNVAFESEEKSSIDGNNNKRYQEDIDQDRKSARNEFLSKIYYMLSQPNSSLFHGLISSSIDPNFSLNLIEDEQDEDDIVPFSPILDVKNIMEKYKDVQISETFIDHSHFLIYLAFEGKIAPIHVPNPAVIRRRDCTLWPFEVKQALGFMGNMQELWVEPIALVPRDLAKSLSDPIYFQPSARQNGAILINVTLLKPNITYDVHCEDKRDEALNSLTSEEMEMIKETFQKYDINGDDGISKTEMEELVRQRTQERKEAVEQKFQLFLKEAGNNKEDIAIAEQNRASYLQQLQESQNKMMEMFNATDVNGDGVISLTEFIMTEAWWLRCTLNPDRAHLF